MKKYLFAILIGLFWGGTALAATSVFQVQQGGTGASTLSGCLSGNGTGAITGSGSACGSGGGGTDPFTHPVTNPFTSATTSNLLLSGSTTLQNFTAINSTSSNATTTNFFTSTASTTGLWLATGSGMLSVSGSGQVQSTTVSSPISFSAATLSCPTCALTATTITINGTAGQITSSAGSQDLSANHTWTLSLPSFVQITNLTLTNSTTTLATTTQATTTTFAISRLASVPLYVNSIGSVISAGSGTSGNCMQWGASNTLGDAGSACGTGGGSVDQWSPHFALGYSATTSVIGIGTTSPQWMLTVSSSTRPQLALTDASLTANSFTLRSTGGFLYIATASPSTFATSSLSTISILPGGQFGTVSIGSTTAATSSAMQIAANALGGLLVHTPTNIANAFAIFNSALNLVFGVDTNQSTSWFGVGTTTRSTTGGQNTFSVTAGPSATTTVTVGDIGVATSKGCVNMNRSDGGAGSFYLNPAGALTSEANYCK